jgi:hypothetical protein
MGPVNIDILFELRLHLLVTATGRQVEFGPAPGAQADIPAFNAFSGVT